MAQFCESLNFDSALVLRLSRETIEPLENWYRAVRFAVENDLGLRHAGYCLTNFAKLRKSNCIGFNDSPLSEGLYGPGRLTCWSRGCVRLQ